MTMPHLMNCPHSTTDWCLLCVGKLWEERTHYKQLANIYQEMLRSAEQEVEELSKAIQEVLGGLPEMSQEKSRIQM